MDSNRASTLLNIAAGYKVALRHWQWFRLQKHGRLHWLRLEFDPGRHDFSAGIFLSALLQADCYQQIVFDHTALPWPGRHGPFLLESLSIDDYVSLTPIRAEAQIRAILRADKWLTPQAKPEQLGKVDQWLHNLAEGNRLAFRLEACRSFNATARDGKDFEHEWAHALVEFHEYLFVDDRCGSCDLLYLAYE